jgi:hypothetical protein
MRQYTAGLTLAYRLCSQGSGKEVIAGGDHHKTGSSVTLSPFFPVFYTSMAPGWW